jgi:hypothetical protein
MSNNEYIPTGGHSPNITKLPTSMTPEQFNEWLATQSAERAHHAPPQPSVIQSPITRGYEPQPKIATVAPPAPAETAPPAVREKLITKRRALTGIAVIAVGGIVFGYNSNVAGVQDIIRDWTNPPASASELSTNTINQYDSSILSPDNCKDPEAGLLAASIEGYMPLVPRIPTTDVPAPANVKPYMTAEQQATLKTAEERDLFGEHITSDHYQHATLDIDLQLNACAIEGKNAITEKNGTVLSIDRSALALSFEGPDGLFGTGVKYVPQVNSADNITLDPTNREYMTLPQQIFTSSADPVANDALNKMKEAIKTESQRNIILALMEQKAVQSMNNIVSSPDYLTFMDANVDSMTEAIDDALIKLLGCDPNNPPEFIGVYDMTANVQKDPATKLPITADANGNSTLVGLDSSQKFVPTKMQIKIGTIIPPEPSPVVTPTPTPVETDAP